MDINIGNKRLNKYAAKNNVWKSQKLKFLSSFIKSSIERDVNQEACKDIVKNDVDYSPSYSMHDRNCSHFDE